eukprot:gene11524-11667_t
MRAWKVCLIFGILLTASFVRAQDEEATKADEAEASEAEDDEDYTEADRAHLIVRKYFKDELGVQGRNLTVYLELYNAGTATANDVQLKDAVIPENLTLIDGTLETSLGKIDVGSTATHSYVVKAEKGSFVAEFDPALVTYKPEFDSNEEQTTRSNLPAIYVMTPVEQITRYALIAGSYASLGMATTTSHWRNLAIFAAVVAVGLAANNMTKSVTKSRTDRNRARALQELEKEQ